MAESSGNEAGQKITFIADVSQVRKALDEIRAEAAQVINVSLRGGGAASGPGGSIGPAAGRISGLMGDPPAMVQEDARRAERLSMSMASAGRVERVAARFSAPAMDWSSYFASQGQDLDTSPAQAQMRPGLAQQRFPIPPPMWSHRWDEPVKQTFAPPPLVNSGRWDEPARRTFAPPPLVNSGRWDEPQKRLFTPPPLVNSGRWDTQEADEQIRMGRLRMLATAGFGAAVGVGLAGAYSDRNTAYAMAGNNPMKQYEAETSFYASVANVPILGSIASYIADPTGQMRSSAITAQSSKDQDVVTATMRHTAEARRGIEFSNQSSLAVNDYDRQRVGVREKYDAMIGQDGAITSARREAEAAAATTRDNELKKVKDDFGASDPDELLPGNAGTGSGGGYAQGSSVLQGRQNEMRSRIQSAQQQYTSQMAGITKKYDDLAAGSARAQNADNDAINRDQRADQYSLAVRAEAGRLRANDQPDEADRLMVSGMGSAAWMKMNPNDIAGRNAQSEASRAEQDALAAAQNRSNLAKSVGSYGNTFANYAGARGDTFREGLIATATAGAVGFIGTENASQKPAALREGLSAIIKYLGTANLKTTDLSGEAAVQALSAQGNEFGAGRLAINNLLTAQLRSSGPESDAYKAMARAGQAGITRAEGLYYGGLNTSFQVSAAQAMGTDPGGYEMTAQARAIGGNTLQALAGAGTQKARDLIGATGINQLTSLARDVQGGGSAQEVSPGTVGPGFGGSGDQITVLQEIKALVQQIKENSGGGGAGGDFGDSGASSLSDF